MKYNLTRLEKLNLIEGKLNWIEEKKNYVMLQSMVSISFSKKINVHTIKLFVEIITIIMLATFFLVRQNNWPPLPKGFCYQPCFYLDISVEIPPDFQHVVRQLYYLWLCK